MRFETYLALGLIGSAVALSGCYGAKDSGADEAQTIGDAESSTSGNPDPSVSDTSSLSSPTDSTGGTEPGDSTEPGESSESSESSESGESSSSTTAGSTCGDGTVDEGEECDDANGEDADACSNDCESQFYTGTAEPCEDYGQTLCGYFEAQCHVAPDGPPQNSLCYWPQAPEEEDCDGTSGLWTADDSPFAINSGFDYPPGGACITQIANLTCHGADTQACADAFGTLCFLEIAPGGGPVSHPLCWWDVDEAACDSTPGLWTTADSGFGQGHPNSLPPSGAAQCILQVPFV